MRVAWRLAAAVAVWVLAAACSAPGQTSATAAHTAGPNLVSNGDFEAPLISKPWTLVANGTSSLPGWTVSRDGVEIVSSGYWMPAPGRQSANLSSNGRASAVAQQIETSTGTTYAVRWYMSANPQCKPPNDRGMDVMWDGQLVATRMFAVGGHTFQSMGWTAETVEVKAVGSSSTLEFER